MKKIFLITFLLLLSLLFFSGCWISPDYKEYEEIEGILYFYDYETMKSVTIPKINKSFSSWHWDSSEFDKKYNQYNKNINKNSEDLSVLNSSDYSYAVRNKKSAKKVVTSDGKTVTGEFFWITSKYEDSVIFFQN